MSTGPEIVLRPAVMHLCKPMAPATATIVKNELCTAGRKAAGFTRHIEFDLTGTELAGRCIPGQAIGVLPDGADKDGREHKLRLYSIASPTRGEDGKGNVHSTTVKRVIDEHWNEPGLFLGVASNWLCDRKPGDKIRVTGPNGKRFVLPADAAAHDYVFFATGTGVAPFRGMITDLLESGVQSKIALVMGSPYSTDLLYDKWLRAMAEKHKANFSYITAISREPNHAASGGATLGPMYVQDRIASDYATLEPLLTSPRCLVYICGLAGMEIGIFRQLARTLPAASREGYIEADAEALANVDGWARTMLHKQIKLTRRVFMEVY
jgi:ferredoxin--NADP+ reductase